MDILPNFGLIVVIGIVVFIIVAIFKPARIVPQKVAVIV